MNILINASGLKKGGGLQVADSICKYLKDAKEHQFTVVLSTPLKETAELIQQYSNVDVYIYDRKISLKLLLTGRDRFLDDLVKEKKIDGVLTIFGPSLWCPKCWHVCGFARPQLVIPESPYFSRMSKKERFKHKIQNSILTYYFRKGTDAIWTENPFISERVKNLLNKRQVYTVTNTYNQIFDTPDFCTEKILKPFDGIRLLSVNAYYDHKNLEIAIPTAQYLKKIYPDLKFKFVFTIDEGLYPPVPENLKEHFEFLGRVDITEVSSLYSQSHICFQPTLLECFTATYAEAMRVGLPIVTTDLEFSRGLCGDSAEYYDALNPEACAESIYKVATNLEYKRFLVQNGRAQLNKFDDAKSRAKKLIDLVANNQKKEK